MTFAFGITGLRVLIGTMLLVVLGSSVYWAAIGLLSSKASASVGSTSTSLFDPTEVWDVTLEFSEIPTITWDGGTRVFGVRPDCTTGFEFGDPNVCDDPRLSFFSVQFISSFYYPNNPPDPFFDTTRLLESRYSPGPGNVTSLLWPLRIELNGVPAGTYNVSFSFQSTDIDTIPNDPPRNVLLLEGTPDALGQPVIDFRTGTALGGGWNCNTAAGTTTCNIDLVATSSVAENFTILVAEARRVAKILIDPPITTQATPKVMPTGSTSEFTVQVRPMGELVNAVSLSMRFDPTYLEVVDQDPGELGVQIGIHPDNPLTLGPIENEADNVAGTIRYTVASFTDVSGDFNVAIITFLAKDTPTDIGIPTEVEFVVSGDNETVLTGPPDFVQILENTNDFTGAWIELVVLTEAIIDAPATADEGSIITFDGTESTAAQDETITAYDWNFSDGRSASGQIVQHVFADDSPSTGSLTVTDSAGDMDTVIHNITINNVAPTIDNITAFPDPVNEGGNSTITVDASDPAGANDPLLYSFDCNDDDVFEVVPQFGNSSICFFPDGSLHRVNVEVDDQDGGVTTAFRVVNVEDVPPTLVISGNPSTDEGSVYTLNLSSTDSGDDTITSWTINWGDGTPPEVVPGNSASVNHVFADGPATPTINATATDEDGGPYNSNSLLVNINNVSPTITNVVADPSNLPHTGGASTATVTAADPAGVNDPLLYFFDCDGDNIFEVGPQLSNLATCPFTSADLGNNTVNVKVDDQDGGVDTSSTVVTVMAPPVTYLCRGMVATIVGTNGDDFLLGTDGPDVIVGLNGDDVILALKGGDVVCGGSGADFISGGSGKDWLYGEAGLDDIRGGTGPDRLFGGGNDDFLRGGKGNDRLFGNAGRDVLEGNVGHDRLVGHSGNDIALGGPGIDDIRCGSGFDFADGGSGIDLPSTACEAIVNIP